MKLTVINPKFMLLIKTDFFSFITRPGGQSGEIRNLTEVTTFGVIKNEVETRQPGSISVVETISIASQTDPIKNLSPVLPFKGFQVRKVNV